MNTFEKLHRQTLPLLIGNVWDVPSAKIAELVGFQAIGTSSAAIAKMLGYEDGEEMTFSELSYIVERINANTQLPLSVDLEVGYSRDLLFCIATCRARKPKKENVIFYSTFRGMNNLITKFFPQQRSIRQAMPKRIQWILRIIRHIFLLIHYCLYRRWNFYG